MKFNKEDIGLYFALGLTGAGVGLLVGAFISSRITKKKNEIIVISEGEIDFEVDEEETDIPLEADEDEDLEMEKELIALTERYSPNQMQLEMVRNGMYTVDQLEELLQSEEDYEPTSYSKKYAHKPDLKELVEEVDAPDDLIDDRWMIHVDAVEEGMPEPTLKFFYDSNDESFVLLSGRGNLVPMASLDSYISDECWEAARPLLLAGGNVDSFVFIEDYETERLFQINMLPEDMEELTGGSGKWTN